MNDDKKKQCAFCHRKANKDKQRMLVVFPNGLCICNYCNANHLKQLDKDIPDVVA